MDRYRKYKDGLIRVGDALRRHGVEFVLVGSAVLPLVYNIDLDPVDLDLFIINKSTILDYELFEKIAQENEWDIGTTDHGTIYYELVVSGELLKIDLLENILDIYIPPQIIENSLTIKIDNFDIRSIRLEDLLVLKAKMATKDAEDFIANIARMLADPKYNISINKSYIKNIINLFTSEKENIIDRLNKNGIYIE
ncbi:MAG: nucleotidyltransferase [Thermoproteus sp.]|jgi:predicted nucleotidyltransferase